MSALTVLFRADGNLTIGAGHIVRCLALAEGFRETGISSCFCSASLDPYLQKLIQSRGFALERLCRSNYEAEISVLLATGRRGRTMGIFLDRYGLPQHYAKRIKEIHTEWTVAQIDDWVSPLDSLDLVVNPNIYATVENYASISAQRPHILAGSKYALLRSEFRNDLFRRRIVDKVEKVLVTLGGTRQPDNLLQILRALVVLPGNFQIHVITGVPNNSYKDLVKFISKHPRLVSYTHVENMGELMGQMDLSISASGSTLWELYYMGVPNIIYILADNQKRTAETAHKRGYSINLGPIDQFAPEPLQEAVLQLLSSPQLRKERAQRCRTAIDGRGVERVRDEFLRLTTGKTISSKGQINELN